MTILVPAIVPDLEPPESHSLMKKIYFRTVGKWISEFLREFRGKPAAFGVLDIRTILGGGVCRSRDRFCRFPIAVA